MVLALSVNVLADGEEFNFSLLANGKVSETVLLGDTVDVTLVITKNDGAETYDLYSAQDYIYFDEEHLEIEEVKGYTQENIQIFSANPVKLMEKIDRVFTNRDSLSAISVPLPLTAVTITFKAIKTGTTELTHDTPEMLESSVNHSIKTENAVIRIISDSDVRTVTFETNGGSAISALTKNVGDTVDFSKYTSKRTGYSFGGWYLDDEFSTKAEVITISDNVTVYAKWVEKDDAPSGGGGGGISIPKRTITFMTTDGVVLDEVKNPENMTVNLLTYIFDKKGYVFEGWYTDKALTNKVTSIKMEKDVTLYANWKSDDSVMLGNRPDTLTTEHYAYIVGREGGFICPQDNITRAEVATIFYRLLEEKVRDENEAIENDFSDVNENNWFNTAVSTLSQMKIVNGRSAESFEPNAFITRAEFTTIAARLSEKSYDGESLFTDIAGHWAENYINTAANLGWVVGENNRFRPDDYITRAEVMTLVNRVLCRNPENKDDLHKDMKKWVDNANEKAWYYIAVQEATNSHDYEMKSGGVYEKWTKLTENPDWSALEK